MLIIDLQKCAILSYKIYNLVFCYVSCSSSTSALLGKDIVSLNHQINMVTFVVTLLDSSWRMNRSSIPMAFCKGWLKGADPQMRPEIPYPFSQQYWHNKDPSLNSFWTGHQTLSLSFFLCTKWTIHISLLHDFDL